VGKARLLSLGVGPALGAEQGGMAITALVTDPSYDQDSHLLTSVGLSAYRERARYPSAGGRTRKRKPAPPRPRMAARTAAA
jgi:uncharacterized protein RhaS with RHS repeats